MRRRDHRLGAGRRDLGAEEHAGQSTGCPCRARSRRTAADPGPALPDADAPPPVREARTLPGEDAPADRVDDEIDAAPAGDRAHLVDPVVV